MNIPKTLRKNLSGVFGNAISEEQRRGAMKVASWFQNIYYSRQAFLKTLRDNKVTGKNYSDAVVAWDKENGK